MSDVSMKYDGATVSVLTDSTARSFLVSVGLPKEHLLFVARERADVAVESVGHGRDALCIGDIRDGEKLCVDIATGAVVTVQSIDGSIWHVNDSVPQFGRSLQAFSERYPFYGQDVEQEVLDAAGQEFRECLNVIDSTALREDPGFWSMLVLDIIIGDYGVEG